jgi:hypothetical protein
MNRREKKRLRKNYLNLIDNKISEHERSGLWSDDIDDTAYYNKRSTLIRLLKELKDIISNTDFRVFYHLRTKYLLPNKRTMSDGEYYMSEMEKYLDKIKEDELVNRDFSLNSLLNDI